MTVVDPPSAPPPPAPTTSTTALALGFRFHPTDEELVSYYLKHKVTNHPLRVDAISEIDLYKSEPWDLPAKSRIQSRDMEWYFFCSLDRKYANRSRPNRATGSGYWKTTNKDHRWSSSSSLKLVGFSSIFVDLTVVIILLPFSLYFERVLMKPRESDSSLSIGER